MEDFLKITCPDCGGCEIMKSGRNAIGVQRYCCQSMDCEMKTFMLEYQYKAYEPGVKEKIVDMVINGSGLRDTARTLHINTVLAYVFGKRKDVVFQEFKKLLDPFGISHYYNGDYLSGLFY